MDEIKQPCAFLLGAGFSKWIFDEMPLMSEIVKYDDEMIRELRSRGLENFIPTEKFENLMSYLSGDYPWLNSSEKYYFKALNEKIKDSIIKKFQSLDVSLSFSDLWLSAKKALDEAQTICILGYSLPESDIYVSFLFNHAIRQKKKIIIVNKDNSDVFKERVKKMFTANVELELICGENAIDNFIGKYFSII